MISSSPSQRGGHPRRLCCLVFLLMASSMVACQLSTSDSLDQIVLKLRPSSSSSSVWLPPANNNNDEVWRDTTFFEPVDLSCDPCLDRDRCIIPGELERAPLRDLCTRGKSKLARSDTWQPQTTPFALLTMFEPSRAFNNRKTLLNLAAMLESVDVHFPYQADFLILVDRTSHTEMRLLQAITHRRLVFVNVLAEFSLQGPEQNMRQRQRTKCLGDDTYRSMCRFASGPIFWMSSLAKYDYFIRIDEDAKFASRVPSNLVSNLQQHDSPYGYALEQPSSSQCRIGLNDTVVDFINTVDHDKLGRPWLRLGDFKFQHSSPGGAPPRNEWDLIDATKFNKHPKLTQQNPTFGALDVNSSTVQVQLSYGTYNCNFEVVRLDYFRHAHYQRYWSFFNEEGLFFSTRMGDHEVKTSYLELFESNQRVACFADLPYFHPRLNREWCKYNRIVKLFTSETEQVRNATTTTINSPLN